MTLTAAQRAQECQTCAADPNAAPRRYCAPLRCRCGHPPCPAFASWEPRKAPEPLPDNVIHLSSRATGLELIEGEVL